MTSATLDKAKALVFNVNAVASDREYARSLLERHDPVWLTRRDRQRSEMGLGAMRSAVRLEGSLASGQKLVISAAR